MSNTAMIVSIVSVLGWLLLSLGTVGDAVERYGRVGTIKMVLAWAAIIGLVAWAAGRIPA